MKKILLIIILLAASNLYSQDTVNAKFFPMHVGNYYVYKTYDWMYTTYWTETINRDTIINGHRYFNFYRNQNQQRLLRYDTASSNLLQYKPGQGCSIYPNDEILDSLGSAVGNTLHDCGIFDFKTCSSRTDSLLTFAYDGIIYGQGTYRKGVGYIYSCSGEPPPCEGFTDLLGAVINGVLWGDTTLTTIHQSGNFTPESYKLYQNFPNPFNPSTSIKFDIPKSGNVNVSIYDLTGKLIETLDQ